MGVRGSARQRLEVSRRIRDEFQNGRDYYAFHGKEVAVPARPQDRPSREVAKGSSRDARGFWNNSAVT